MPTSLKRWAINGLMAFNAEAQGRREDCMTENEISAVILDAAIAVHNSIGGPGVLESYYEAALASGLA